MALFGGGRKHGDEAADDPAGRDRPLTYPEIVEIQKGTERVLKDAAKREQLEIEKDRARRSSGGNTGSNNESGGV